MIKSLITLSLYLLSVVAQAEELKPKFAWPTSGKVRVREKTIKKGNRAVTSYDLVLKSEGDKFRIVYTNFKFLLVNGIPPTDPRLAQLKVIEKSMVNSLPELLISNDGHYLDLANFDAIVNGVAAVAKDKLAA